MKRLYMMFLLIISIAFIPNVKAVELNINSRHALLYNLNDDTILYEKNSNDKTSIASLTKIMTAMVVIDKVDNLDKKITLTYADFYGLAEANLAQAGFYVGEVVTYRDLLYGLLFPSGADAAQSLARNVAGNNDNFVKLMNEKASILGMNNTHFMNVTGLDDDNHYSTLKDVAIMFKYALKNEEFKKIISTKDYTTSDNYLKFSSVGKRANNMGMNYVIGGKTGTTDDAGLCLATIASHDGVNYMLITTRAPWDRNNPLNFIDAKTIYDYFMNNYGYKTIIDTDDEVVTLKTLYAKKDLITFKSDVVEERYLKNDFSKSDIEYVYTGVDIITVDMPIGTKLGSVGVYLDGEMLTSVDVILNEKLEFDLNKYLDAHRREVGMAILTILLFSLLTASAIVDTINKIKNKNKK